MNDLSTTVDGIFALHEDSLPDAFAEASNLLDAVKECVRQLDAAWKAAALQRVEKHGEMTLGTKRYYASYEVYHKARDVRQVIERILAETGGDFDALVGCLSVNAMKPGSCRKVLSQAAFGECFDRIDRTALRTGDAKTKELIEVDTRFTT